MSTKVRGEARETMILSVAQLSPAAQQMAKPANGKAANGVAAVASAAPAPERRNTGNLTDSALLNRELSWIEFNSRVLD